MNTSPRLFSLCGAFASLACLACLAVRPAPAQPTQAETQPPIQIKVFSLANASSDELVKTLG